jgi:hypothetical protein
MGSIKVIKKYQLQSHTIVAAVVRQPKYMHKNKAKVNPYFFD